MKNKLREFFDINESYRLEWMDISTLLTILNVTFIIGDFWWAPLIGIVNCGCNLALAPFQKAHINFYVMQFALIVLNIYFLM